MILEGVLRNSWNVFTLQALIPVPGVGAIVGGVIGGVLGGVAGGIGGDKGAKRISGKLYEMNISRKCPLCWLFIIS